jgi:glycosyltransferase involved in cell wall biosynthesis
MTELRKFIAWQPVLTDHQAFTFHELARQAGAPAIAYVTRMEDTTRQAQGWTDTQVSSVERRLIPKRGSLYYCYRQLLAYRKDVHIFGSAFQEPKMMGCLLLAMWLGVEFYLISEPYSPVEQGYFSDGAKLVGRLKVLARPFVYRAYALILRRKTAGIFAISKLAVAQYQAAGIAPAKLFSFGYFVPRIAHAVIPPAQSSSTQGSALRIVFVGSLIARKGLDILIEAVRSANTLGHDISLDVFGPGDPKAFSFDGQRVRYCGRIPFGKTQEVVASYDLLVLPSRYDGWGVVVNEALCVGVPVICSDQAGAGLLIDKFRAGAKFASGDSHALADLLAMLASDRSQLQVMREATAKAATAIQPEVAAAYMLTVIRAPRGDKALIPSPWYPD